MAFDTVPSGDTIARAAEALKKNAFNALVVRDGVEARERALALVPPEADVMVMTSVTLDTLGISAALAEHPGAVRKKLGDEGISAQEKKRLSAGPDVAVGSVHAVTLDGHVLIASATGSQLPAYVYGAGKVVWVVGAQKIVTDVPEGMRRIQEHTLPLEDARARKAYGVGSAINNLLIMNAHPSEPARITLILVPEKLGF